MAELNWDDMRVFLALARAGTLSAAAAVLKSGAATVSRRIDRLERAFGLPLFLRHQSGYRLTDQGEALLHRAEAVEMAMHELGAEAGAQDEVAGLVRLASITSFVTPLIVPTLGPLLAENPRLDVEILNGIETVNLHRRDADLALRLVRPERGHLLVRHLGTMGFGLYGPPDGSRPARHVTWIDQGSVQTVLSWSRAFGADATARLAVNTPEAQSAAVAQGLGVCVMPHFLARPAGLALLAETLPDGTRMSRDIFLVTHADLAASRRVRRVADCLAEAVIARRADLAEP